MDPLDITLSYTHPELVGPIDNDEIELICDSAYDLVLIENASELFRQVMMSPDVIENILKHIVHTSSPCFALPSETFSIKNTAMYQSEVSAYREIVNLRLNQGYPCLVAVVALDLGRAGHYGVLWYQRNTQTVEIFDSMEQGPMGSSYTKDFRRLARDIFETDSIIHPACINLDLTKSLQFTGGFPENRPAMLIGRRMNLKLRQAIQRQATESQNHFCYMWSIWYIHLRLKGFNPSQVIDEIAAQHLDPLFVIKRYIYCLVYTLGLRSQIQYPNFFDRHFPSIWTNGVKTNDKNRLTLEFRRFRLNMRPSNNIDECLVNSLRDLGVTPEPHTPVPREIRERYCQSAQELPTKRA
jgi:hypothetical protein